MVEPSTHDECIALWNYCYRNAQCLHGIIDNKLRELGMFDNCESSLNYDSYNSGGNENDFSFLFVFLENMKIIVTFNSKPKNVREVGSIYTTEDQITSL